MASDSLALIAAALLLVSALTVVRGGGYLRFAALLFAALALAVMAQRWTDGLADAVALIVLPLGGVALGLSALARFGRRLPALPATLLLSAGLGCGLGALLGGGVILVLAPLALGGVIVIFAGLNRMAASAAIAGALLVAAACAFIIAGAGAASLSLLAAALCGLGIQSFASSRPATFSPGLP